jgi:hypothetical protein
MRDFMKLVESLSENTDPKKKAAAEPSAAEYKDADDFDGTTINMGSGASKGQVSSAQAARDVGQPGPIPGRVTRGAKQMKAGLDGQSLNYLGDLMGSGLEDYISDEDAADTARLGRNEVPALATDGAEPLPVTPENLPAVISQAIMDTSAENPGMVVFDPEWTMVRDLPGYMVGQIRALGRMVFEPFTNTPIEDINVMAAPFVNTKRDLDMMAHWIRRYGIRDDEAEMKFDGIMPGYAAQTQIWNAEGYTFMLVMDHAGGYIYSWPGGRGVHLDAPEERRLLREGACGQCEGTGTIEGGLGGYGDDEECPVCDGSGEIDDEDDDDYMYSPTMHEAAEHSTEAREANLHAAKDVFDAQEDAEDEAEPQPMNEGVTKFQDEDGKWYVQTSRNGHVNGTHGPFEDDAVDAVYDSFASEDNDPLNGDGSPWAGFNESAEAPSRADDLAHILGQVHVHNPLSNPWGIPFVEGDETMAAMAKINEATKAPAVEATGEILTEAQKFARLAGIGVKAKAVNASPEAAQIARQMAALAGIRR